MSDASSGAGGDIEIMEGGAMLLTAEVTERTVEANRTISTFNTEIGPYGIKDYLFSLILTHQRRLCGIRGNTSPKVMKSILS